jgi:hypothetical protein
MIGRRELITLLGGAAATWPLAARAPSTHLHAIVRLQPAAVARAGVLSGGTPPPPAPQRLQRESRDLIGRPEAANHSPRGQKRALGSHAGVAQGEIGTAPPTSGGWAGRTQRGGSGRPVPCETVFLRVRGCPLIEVEPAVNVAMR